MEQSLHLSTFLSDPFFFDLPSTSLEWIERTQVEVIICSVCLNSRKDSQSLLVRLYFHPTFSIDIRRALDIMMAGGPP